MWAIDDVASWLNSVGSWLNNAGAACNQIPLVGPIVGGPLQTAGSAIQYAAASMEAFGGAYDQLAATVAADAGTVANDVWSAIETAVSDAQSALQEAETVYSYVSGYLYQYVVTLEANTQTLYQYVQNTLIGEVNSAISQAQAAYAYATGYLTSLANSALQQADATWSYIQNVPGGLAQAVWGWITSGSLQTWLNPWIDSMKDRIVSYVTASLGYLIAQKFTLLANSWASFEDSYVWLLDQCIALMGRQAAHFAGALWALLEIILDAIERPGG